MENVATTLSRPTPPTAAPARRGFTLVEMLVVIGIIAVLAGLALVAVHAARGKAEQARMAADLQTIATALDAYKADFGDYPRLPVPQKIGDPSNLGNAARLSGGELLCWALVGPYPQANPGTGNPFNDLYDGADGPGFRTSPSGRGKVYQSYLNVERFKIGYDARSPVQRYKVILDSQDGSILYFPMNHRAAGATLSPAVDRALTAIYDFRDNEVAFWRQGDINPSVPLARMSILLDNSSAAPFLLWSAGPDQLYGPKDLSNPTDVNSCDDVTNIKY